MVGKGTNKREKNKENHLFFKKYCYSYQELLSGICALPAFACHKLNGLPLTHQMGSPFIVSML